MEEKYIEYEEAIKKFLLDIDCLDNISILINKFNIFDVLRIGRTEIRHSNMLAWLFDPNENHGLGDKVLVELIKLVIDKLDNSKICLRTLNLLLKNNYSFNVFREYNNIDLLLISSEHNIVICIENKIDSREHNNQLARYKNFVEMTYSEYEQYYLYLTPLGTESSDLETWISISYKEIVSIIEKALIGSSLSSAIAMLIENYLEIIKRDIMDKQEIKQLCNEIYLKHKKALDFIYYNKSKEMEIIYNNLISWLESNESIIDKSSIIFDGNNFIRFKTLYLNKLFPDELEKESGWGTTSFYYYELEKRQNKCVLQLAFSYSTCSLEYQKKIEQCYDVMGKKFKKKDWPHLFEIIYDLDKIIELKNFINLEREILSVEEKLQNKF